MGHSCWGNEFHNLAIFKIQNTLNLGIFINHKHLDILCLSIIDQPSKCCRQIKWLLNLTNKFVLFISLQICLPSSSYFPFESSKHTTNLPTLKPSRSIQVKVSILHLRVVKLEPISFTCYWLPSQVGNVSQGHILCEGYFHFHIWPFFSFLNVFFGCVIASPCVFLDIIIGSLLNNVSNFLWQVRETFHSKPPFSWVFLCSGYYWSEHT